MTEPGKSSTSGRIEQRLRERFAPVHFELRDESASHAGHAGAAGGGGHYQVWIVSAAFEGLTLLERHRAVYAALEGMLGGEVHALAMRTQTPAERNA